MRRAVRCCARRFASSTVRKVPLLINGKLRQSETDEWLEVRNPATGEVVALCPEATTDEKDEAVETSHEAQQEWKEMSISNRTRILARFTSVLQDHTQKLAAVITEEQGKPLRDAVIEVQRGVEALECALAAPTLFMGETLENVSRHMDTYSYRQPLGVCAGITPSHFPVMLPLWMFPAAVVYGNAFVLKPSERVPSASVKVAEIALQAGVPAGVLNVIHGSQDAVEYVCDAPSIKALSFVGSNQVGGYVHARATANGKRVHAALGAKNHAVVLPDAPEGFTLDALMASSLGALCQRCMAVSVVVLVGSARALLPSIVARAAALRVGRGTDPATDVGPMITPLAKHRACDIIQSAADDGATILLDGRDVTPPDGCSEGNWLGPTILTNITPEMACYTSEIFGPVLCVMTADTLDDAIKVVNDNPFGHGTALFTTCGASARKFQHEVNVGQIGINVGIPTAAPMFSFTGSKASVRGDRHFHSKEAAYFFSQTKTVTSNWNSSFEVGARASTAMPILGDEPQADRAAPVGDLLSLVAVVPYGVLGQQLVGDDVVQQAPLPRSPREVVVDPAGLPFIRHGPAGAGGAAAAIYKWVGDELLAKNTFPSSVLDGIAKPTDSAGYVYQGDGGRAVVHAVGPDLREDAYSDPALAAEDLTRTYVNILRSYVALLPEGREEGADAVLRMLPVSGGIFSGPYKEDLPHLTARCLAAALRHLEPHDCAALAARTKRIELCIFAAAELPAYSAAAAEVKHQGAADRGGLGAGAA